jgi:hypothetical protein
MLSSTDRTLAGCDLPRAMAPFVRSGTLRRHEDEARNHMLVQVNPTVIATHNDPAACVGLFSGLLHPASNTWLKALPGSSEA